MRQASVTAGFILPHISVRVACESEDCVEPRHSQQLLLLNSAIPFLQSSQSWLAITKPLRDAQQLRQGTTDKNIPSTSHSTRKRIAKVR